MAKTLKHLDLTYNAALRVDTNTIRPKKYALGDYFHRIMQKLSNKRVL